MCHSGGSVQQITSTGGLRSVRKPEDRGPIEQNHEFIVRRVHVKRWRLTPLQFNDHVAHVLGVQPVEALSRRRHVVAGCARKCAGAGDVGSRLICRVAMLALTLVLVNGAAEYRTTEWSERSYPRLSSTGCPPHSRVAARTAREEQPVATMTLTRAAGQPRATNGDGEPEKRRPPLSFDPVTEAKRNWRLRWSLAEEMAAATSIMRTQAIILADVEEQLRPFGLTFARYETLALLYFSRQGSLPLGKMGARLQVHPTSVTNCVDRLEAQGLLRRVAHPKDRRTTLAEITPEGRRVVQRATPRLLKNEFGLQSLTRSELETLTRVLRKVRLAAGDFSENGTA
jgi:DNA-binding MarR family transcriptional regulator